MTDSKKNNNPLPLYKVDRPCAKCGSKMTGTIYMTCDLMKRVCARCTYTWKEKPLDSQPNL